MLSTKDMSAGSGNTKPVISVGNQKVKINSISFDPTPYDAESFNIVLNVESEPITGEFNGFSKDMNNPNSERYLGQVGRVRFSQYPYKDAILPSGREISKDTEVLKGMVYLSEVLNKREALDKIEANTIELFMDECNKLFSNSEYINACIGGREWENKEGYINFDLYLPKMSKEGIPLEAIDKENSRLLTYDENNKNHLRKIQTQNAPTTTSFEPATATGDHFDL